MELTELINTLANKLVANDTLTNREGIVACKSLAESLLRIEAQNAEILAKLSKIKCQSCDGKGHFNLSGIRSKCADCNGTGKI